MATRSGGSEKPGGSRSGSGRTRASQRTGTGGRAAGSERGDKSVEAFRDALERSVTLSRDRLRRRAGVTAGGPITGYEQLTASQIKSRLRGLSPAELRKLRTREQRGKARKSVLQAIERRLK